MLTALTVRLQVLLAAQLQNLITVLYGRRQRLGTARGITFIEYAILAAIAVAIGFIFRNQLGTLFKTLFDRLGTAISIN